MIALKNWECSFQLLLGVTMKLSNSCVPYDITLLVLVIFIDPLIKKGLNCRVLKVTFSITRHSFADKCKVFPNFIRNWACKYTERKNWKMMQVFKQLNHLYLEVASCWQHHFSWSCQCACGLVDLAGHWEEVCIQWILQESPQPRQVPVSYLRTKKL